jgi:hypothetical protein
MKKIILFSFCIKIPHLAGTSHPQDILTYLSLQSFQVLNKLIYSNYDKAKQIEINYERLEAINTMRGNLCTNLNSKLN